MQELKLEHCENIWWVRFGLDGGAATLAVGNALGRTLVYRLEEGARSVGPAQRLRPVNMYARDRATPLGRQAALSRTGAWIACGHDGGYVSVYARAGGASQA